MSIDLTKPIEVTSVRSSLSRGFHVQHLADLLETATGDGTIRAEHDAEWEEYRKLFEEAPLTKHYYKRMLAVLRHAHRLLQKDYADAADYGDPHMAYTIRDLKALLNEIGDDEVIAYPIFAKCSYCGVLGDNGRCQLPKTAESEGNKV